MAKNITLLGASYSDVPAVNLPQTGGGTARFTDTSVTTAVESDVASGKIFIKADGSTAIGTGSGGGGGGGIEITQDAQGYIVLPKNGGGGGSITVEALSVTTNGTYTAPTGKAYSPVTVNVSGGSSLPVAEEKQINFIDYDGTIRYSYSSAEWTNVTVLPENPTHNGLTAQGWNWTMAQITSQLTSVPSSVIWVGQMYKTTSGATEIDLLVDGLRPDTYLGLAINGTVNIEWGDGTTSTATGSSLTTQVTTQHTYSAGGLYTIKVSTSSGSYALYNKNAVPLISGNKTSLTLNRAYALYVRAVRIADDAQVKNYACCNLGNLEYVTIPSSANISTASNAFSTCYNLKSLTIPSVSTSIPAGFCTTCSSLQALSIPSGITAINMAFTDLRALRSILVPYGSPATTVQDYFAQNCYSLTSIVLNGSITTLPSSAFASCYGLVSLTIPSTVTSIGTSAFSYCYGMKEYHFKSTTPPTASGTFINGIPGDCVIYVPTASLNAYQTASGWSTYSSYMQGE